MLAADNSRHEGSASFIKSATIQARTMSALAVRFMVTRYGRENIGFFWIVVEPMILCVGVMVLWSILKGGSEHGIKVVAMVFTGYMPLTLQRHMSGVGIFILRSSKALFIHRNISYYDNLLSRLVLEFLSTSAAAFIIYSVLILFHILDFAYNFGLVITGWIMMASLSAGLACVYAGLSETFESSEKFLPAFNYLMLPLSGFFFMVDWLPYQAQQAILYVPLVHAFEVVRSGMFGPSLITHYSLFYTFSCALVMISIGCLLMDRARIRL